MIKDRIHIYKDTPALCEGVTHFLQSHIFTRKKSINLCLSGGNTPKALFDHWSNARKNDIPWSRITLFWGDERCVPPDSESSNYGMTQKHLLDKVPVPVENIFRIRGENNPEEEATRYSRLLAEKLPSKNQYPAFDLVLLGMGEDGHTASLFPGQSTQRNNAPNCIVTVHPESGMKRISITENIINNAGTVIFLVTGRNKAPIVEEVIRNREAYAGIYPAARITPRNGIVHWFLDKPAAYLIDKTLAKK